MDMCSYTLDEARDHLRKGAKGEQQRIATLCFSSPNSGEDDTSMTTENRTT